MIDAIKAKFEIEHGENIFGLPVFADYTGEVDHKGRYITTVGNMRITYFPDQGKGYVSGSLHKFVKGNNYTAINRHELAAGIADLSAAIGLPPNRFRMLTAEAGANIPTPTDPKPILKTLLHYKRAPFKEIESQQPYMLYRAGLTDYNVKLYNKSRYEGLHGCHLLRYELQFRKSRAILKAAGFPAGYTLTLADLTDTAFLAPLAAHLLKSWAMIERETEVNANSLKPAQILLLMAGQRASTWPMLKPNTRKKYRAEYNRIRKQIMATNACPLAAALKQELREFLGNGFYTPFSPHVIIVKSGQIVGIENSEETAMQEAA